MPRDVDQKPFVAVKLVEMITEVLHTPDRSQLGDEFDTRKDTRRPVKAQGGAARVFPSFA
jgi:hypothetical protein